MRFKAKEWDFLYSKRKEEGLYDLMIYNPTTKDLFFEEKVEKELLSGTDRYGTPYAAVEISKKTFSTLFNRLSDGGYRESFFYDWEADKPTPKRKSKKIPKETMFRAIRGELSWEELDKVVQVTPKTADYYDFDAFLSVIHRFLRGELSRRYYLDWTIVVAWALQSNPFRKNSKRDLLYQALSNTFDGHSFDELEQEKERQCLEMLAYLKYYNHALKNTRKSVEPPFYNENQIAVYVCFDYCNHYNSHYKLCIADEKNEIFKITSVANPFYLEQIHYTFVEKDEFDVLASTYYEFFHDKSIDVHKYIAECPYMDADGKELP